MLEIAAKYLAEATVPSSGKYLAKMLISKRYIHPIHDHN